MKKTLKKLWYKFLAWFFNDPEYVPAEEEQARPKIIWSFGGYNGSGAEEDPDVQIKNVRIAKDRISYKWDNGDLSKWGATDPGDAGKALACAFFWSEANGGWIGGKFDWISTNRTTRDTKNIDGGYNGWDAARFWAAPKRAFCIARADGRKRTNLVEG